MINNSQTLNISLLQIISAIVNGENLLILSKSEYILYSIVIKNHTCIEYKLSRKDHLKLQELKDMVNSPKRPNDQVIIDWIIDYIGESQSYIITPSIPGDLEDYIDSRQKDECGCKTCRPKWTREDFENNSSLRFSYLLLERANKVINLFLDQSRGDISVEQLREKLSYIIIQDAKLISNIDSPIYVINNLMSDFVFLVDDSSSAVSYLRLINIFQPVIDINNPHIKEGYNKINRVKEEIMNNIGYDLDSIQMLLYLEDNNG